jgi:L-threonylcarbamoyladenylate synthase
MARKYGVISEKVQKMIENHWPGALTLIVSKNESKIYSLVFGMGDTVGFRQPNHDVCLELITEVGVPLIGTSANFHGKQTPYKTEDIDPKLAEIVDAVLPGICAVGLASTIVDTTKEPWQILRQGTVKISI